MKTMTCKQLGGACDLEFHAETFDEMANFSQEHAKEMFQNGDDTHLKAIEEMKVLMKDPKAMMEWMKSKQKEFEALDLD